MLRCRGMFRFLFMITLTNIQKFHLIGMLQFWQTLVLLLMGQMELGGKVTYLMRSLRGLEKQFIKGLSHNQDHSLTRKIGILKELTSHIIMVMQSIPKCLQKFLKFTIGPRSSTMHQVCYKCVDQSYHSPIQLDKHTYPRFF